MSPDPDYVRRRVEQSCQQQGVPVQPSDDVLDAVQAIMTVRTKADRRVAA